MRVPLLPITAVVAVVTASSAACSDSRSTTPPTVDAGPGEATTTTNVAAPRPVGPVSVSFLTSRRPTLRWQLPQGADGARVDVCADRGCARVLASFDAPGDHGAPTADLPPGAVFWRLHGMVAGAVGAATSVPWELVVPAQSAPLSTAWGAMLDANGDGFGDVVVGDSDAFAPTQHVFVHHGGAGGPSAAPSSVLSAAAPVAGYASSVASAGDVDGDGFADLLVGSPGEDTVYVYRGGPAGFADPPSAVLTGPAKSSFGAALSGAGDVDGDGYADVVVGLPLLASPSGAALQGGAILYYGGAGGLSPASRSIALGPRAGSDAQSLGTFVSTAGDLDGDGLADVAVWGGIESTDPQYILVYYGGARPFGVAPSALLQYDGASPSWLGHANLLACAGDTNGDGYADLVMSTPVPPNDFTIDHLSLFLGGPGGAALVPSRRIASPLAQMDHFGLSVAGLDANQDGLDDVAASTASYAQPPVSALLYLGGPSSLALSTTMTTNDATTLFERELGSSGDIDGDGFPDLVVGFPARVTPNGDAGADAGDALDAGPSGPLRGAVEVHVGSAQGVGVAARWVLLPPDGTALAYGASLVRP